MHKWSKNAFSRLVKSCEFSNLLVLKNRLPILHTIMTGVGSKCQKIQLELCNCVFLCRMALNELNTTIWVTGSSADKHFKVPPNVSTIQKYSKSSILDSKLQKTFFVLFQTFLVHTELFKTFSSEPLQTQFWLSNLYLQSSLTFKYCIHS